MDEALKKLNGVKDQWNKEPFMLKFSADAFAFIPTELWPHPNFVLSLDEELEQWEIRDKLPPV